MTLSLHEMSPSELRTPTMKHPQRPKPIEREPLRGRAQRWHPDKGWYWLVVRQGRKEGAVWCGYGSRAEVSRRMTALSESGIFSDEKTVDGEPITTVEDLLSYWLGSSVEVREAGGSLSSGTAEKYTYSSKHLIRLIGTVLLVHLDGAKLDEYAKIRRAEVARGKAGRGGRSTSLRTIHLEHITMIAAWRWGIDQGLVPNKRLKPQRLKIPDRDLHVPTRVEIVRVLEQLSGWMWLAVRLQAATGARISEVTCLRAGDADLDAAVIRFPGGKTGAREVPIEPQVVDVLRDWAKMQPDSAASAPLLGRFYVKPGSGVSAELRSACMAAKVTPFTTHALRYRVVIDMLDAGVDPKTASEITGHSIQTMLTIYRKVSTTTKREAIVRAKLGHLPVAPGQVIPFKSSRRK